MLGQIIKEKRKEQGLTLEQVANYLGVSAPAIHKWEKGQTYPDITTLPALARLLQTDLNTLLSFKENLTHVEVDAICTQILTLIEEEGYDVGFNLANDKISEYPSCELLIYHLSDILTTALAAFMVNPKQKYLEILTTWLKRILHSNDLNLRNKATDLIFSVYCQNEEFENAENIVQSLPESCPDKQLLLAELNLLLGNDTNAAHYFEAKLFETSVSLQNILLGLTQISIREKHMDKAGHLASLYQQVTEKFDLMTCTAWTALLEVSTAQKDKETTIQFLKNTLESLNTEWTIENSSLYQHLDFTDPHLTTFSSNLLPAIVNELEHSSELKFLHGTPDYQSLLTTYQKN
ncbi:helix-turn-helix domain-containing protein [Enterococcus sp. HY326]|uniref:helix-turn-helix domain-containing protein n=1 Tax=Enterococcus sp. HY326 TaxID=2971265 RepID=UPI00223EBCFE|nr:helix-turn-helix transcriptional regulator [Enterococcus sp. HY326]